MIDEVGNVFFSLYCSQSLCGPGCVFESWTVWFCSNFLSKGKISEELLLNFLYIHTFEYGFVRSSSFRDKTEEQSWFTCNWAHCKALSNDSLAVNITYKLLINCSASVHQTLKMYLTFRENDTRSILFWIGMKQIWCKNLQFLPLPLFIQSESNASRRLVLVPVKS